MAGLLTSILEWKRPSMVSGYVLNVKKQHHSSFVDRLKHAHNAVNKYRQNIDDTRQTQEPYYTEVLERQTRHSSRRSGKLLVEVHAIIRAYYTEPQQWQGVMWAAHSSSLLSLLVARQQIITLLVLYTGYIIWQALPYHYCSLLF